MVLNMLTTIAMVRTGKTYGNLMVDVQTGSEKLKDRARRIIAIVTGLDYDEADKLLRRAHWNVKAAIVMQKTGLTYTQATRAPAQAHDSIREAIGEDVEPRLRELLRATRGLSQRVDADPAGDRSRALSRIIVGSIARHRFASAQREPHGADGRFDAAALRRARPAQIGGGSRDQAAASRGHGAEDAAGQDEGERLSCISSCRRPTRPTAASSRAPRSRIAMRSASPSSARAARHRERRDRRRPRLR